MSMTEEEAKTKWCPHAVASHTDPRSGVKDGAPLHNCIGSACMAWRETGSHWHLPNGGTWKTKEDVPHFRVKEVVEVKTGFCGLAGAPQ